MSALSQLVTARLEALKSVRDQKSFATAIHDHLVEASAERRTDVSASIARFEETLSKLKNGRGPEHVKATKSLMKTESRLAAFAAALGVEEADLRNACERRTVLFDPAVPSDVRAYFESRAAEQGARGFVQLHEAPTVEALLAVAKETPGCLVVLADHRLAEMKWFSAVEVACSAIAKHPRGWLVAESPELFELPPPEPLELFRDGRPRVPHDQYEEQVVRGLPKAVAWIRSVRDRAGVPTFDVRDVFAFLATRDSLQIAEAGGGRRPVSDILDALAGKARETFWWIHDCRILVAGRDAERLRVIVAPHHEVHEPHHLPEFVARALSFNPFASDEGCAGRAVAKELFAETGLSIDALVAARREALSTRAKQSPRRTTFSRGPCDARERIAALLDREFVFGTKESSRAAVEVPFVLDAVVRAPLLVEQGNESTSLHVVANLGAGRLVRVFVHLFPEDEPSPLVVESGRATEVEGGDVHIWITELSAVPMLEGCALPARARCDAADGWDDGY